MNKVEYKELVTFHPGYYLNDIIADMGVTQDEFAKRLGTTGKTLSNLLNGKINLSSEIALKLSIMLGTSIDVWLNLQKTYTEKVLEIECRKIKDREAEYVRLLDYSFFVNLGLVKKARTAGEKAVELLRYFKIASFDVLMRPDFLVNYRTAIQTVSEKNVLNSNAWVQTAINIGSEIETDKYNSRRLKSHLSEIRNMTLQDPKVFLPRLHEILSSCGIALVILPHLKNSGVNGAVKWITKDKVILAINNRRKYADTFWFSLFHEIGHVFQHRIAMLIVGRAIDDMDELNRELENEADDFAQNILLPKDKYFKFVDNNNYSEEDVKQFAKKMDIQPGIVVGRLQLEKRIGYDRLNSLKQQYTIET